MVGKGCWQKCPGNDIDNCSQGRAKMSDESHHCRAAVLVDIYPVLRGLRQRVLNQNHEDKFPHYLTRRWKCQGTLR